MDEIRILEILVLVGSLGYAVAIYCAYMLSKETGNEKYWFSFVIAAFGLAVHQWIKVPWELGLCGLNLYLMISEIGEIVGGVAFAYGSYGLFRAMRGIRKKMEE